MFKDADKDRQILDRRRRNARQKRVLHSSRFMPHAVQLTMLPLRTNRIALGSLEDLDSYYFQFTGTLERARSQPVGMPLDPKLLTGVAALTPELRRARRVQACFLGLGMGDGDAPDIAQEAHEGVLSGAGCLQPREQLRGKSLFPLAPEVMSREL